MMMEQEIRIVQVEPTEEDLTQAHREWVEARCMMLLEDGARMGFVRGFGDASMGRAYNTDAYVGEPFAADDYADGFGLGCYENGRAA